MGESEVKMVIVVGKYFVFGVTRGFLSGVIVFEGTVDLGGRVGGSRVHIFFGTRAFGVRACGAFVGAAGWRLPVGFGGAVMFRGFL